MSKTQLSLPVALGWIVASMLVFSGGGYALCKRYYSPSIASAPFSVISALVQTGPQKEVLKTEYLAELLHLSNDSPCRVDTFNLTKAQEALLASPLISKAEVKLIKPHTLYVDYTARQPLAWLEDYPNVVIDKEGVPFPFTPFFAPKNLPALYLGLAPFGEAPEETYKPLVKWHKPLQGKAVDLAFTILNCLTDLAVCDQFVVKRIDLSSAFAESYGMREIVITTEDSFTLRLCNKDVQCIIPRFLRLSTKNYAQELGNYLKLREVLLAEEQKTLSLLEPSAPIVRLKEKILDFRLQQLAFIQNP